MAVIAPLTCSKTPVRHGLNYTHYLSVTWVFSETSHDKNYWSGKNLFNRMEPGGRGEGGKGGRGEGGSSKKGQYRYNSRLLFLSFFFLLRLLLLLVLLLFSIFLVGQMPVCLLLGNRRQRGTRSFVSTPCGSESQPVSLSIVGHNLLRCKRRCHSIDKSHELQFFLFIFSLLSFCVTRKKSTGHCVFQYVKTFLRKKDNLVLTAVNNTSHFL